MHTKEAQVETIRAIARKYGISGELDHKGHELLQALELVNIQKSDITCLGLCKNRGLCQRHIARQNAVKGLLGLMRVVFDPSIAGDHLEVSLELKFIHLLCPQHHQTSDQATACMERKIEAVEQFRSMHGIRLVHDDAVGSYAEPVLKVEPTNETPEPVVDWKAACEALALKFKELEIQNEKLQQEVDALQDEVKKAQKEKISVDDENKKLKELVAKTEGKRAATEVENCILVVENDGLKAKTRSVRKTIGSLQHQLGGQESDGEESDTPPTFTIKKVIPKTNKIKTEEPFDFTFKSSTSSPSTTVQTPPSTPSPSTTSGKPWSRTAGGSQAHSDGAVRFRKDVARPDSPTRGSDNLTLSPSKKPGYSDSKEVPFGFRVRPKSTNSRDL